MRLFSVQVAEGPSLRAEVAGRHRPLDVSAVTVGRHPPGLRAASHRDRLAQVGADVVQPDPVLARRSPAGRSPPATSRRYVVRRGWSGDVVGALPLDQGRKPSPSSNGSSSSRNESVGPPRCQQMLPCSPPRARRRSPSTRASRRRGRAPARPPAGSRRCRPRRTARPGTSRCRRTSGTLGCAKRVSTENSTLGVVAPRSRRRLLATASAASPTAVGTKQTLGDPTPASERAWSTR